MLINVNITDITDESGYLESIGRKAAQEAVQKAEIDVAEQEKVLLFFFSFLDGL